jgi:hypothetical protein
MLNIREFTQESPRYTAALWFAIAGSIIPAGLIIAYLMDGGISLIGFLILSLCPMLAAGLAGWLRGWRILDPETVDSGFKALSRGSSTSLLAFALFAIILALLMGINKFSERPTFEVFMENIFSGIFMIVGVGGPYFGLPIIIIGAIAGWLLYRLFAPRIDALEQNIPGDDPAIE